VQELLQGGVMSVSWGWKVSRSAVHYPAAYRVVQGQLPPAIIQRLHIDIWSDAFNIAIHAKFTDLQTSREFRCTLNSRFQIPEDFLAHLCAVV
jgi:hypothetical protein